MNENSVVEQEDKIEPTENSPEETVDDVEIDTDDVTDLESLLSLGLVNPVNVGDLLETEMIANRTLYLSDEITLDTISHIIMLIHKWNRDDIDTPIDQRIPIVLYLDSAGGEIYRGFSLISAIESSATPIIGILQGVCMSMCLPIWLACHVRYASKYSNVLYHVLRAGADVETLIEMENKIKHYKKLQKTIDDYILSKTTIPKKKLKKKRKSNLDWYITFEEMTKYNMYDALID